MDRKIRRKVITGILLVFWMAVIFSFSSQPATESSKISGSLTYKLLNDADGIFRLRLSELEIMKKARALELPIRKAAHMTEYAILGGLFLAFLDSFDFQRKPCFILAFVLSVCYAATDEVHQLYIPGRSGQFLDVCIDAGGVLIGLLIAKAVLHRREKRRKGQSTAFSG